MLESLAADDIEQGIASERHAKRGVFTKGVYEGGAQERVLAQQADEWVNRLSDWPRTQALLRLIADAWRHDAEREDIRAEQDKAAWR